MSDANIPKTPRPRGRPRIENEPRVTLTVRIEESMVRRLRREASDQERALSVIVKRALRSYYAGLDRERGLAASETGE